MSFLSPLSLLWLGSLAALFWLWRLAATKRQTIIPSLIPFEHLLKRSPRRRTRLVVNFLFWLQLAALISLVLALAQPVMYRRQAKTILAVIDTSASMDARIRGRSAFERAKRELLGNLRRKHPSSRVLIMSSAPIAALMAEPQQRTASLKQSVGELRVSHMAGSLSGAAHIGRALLGGVVDEILIATDEPIPEHLASNVKWLGVGEALPNTAIVGLDAQAPLCHDTSARIVVTVRNFSEKSSDITLSVFQENRSISKRTQTLEPHERKSLSLAIPDRTEGWLDVKLKVDRDGLSTDNHAQVYLHSATKLPVVVQSDNIAFREAVGDWLSACEGLKWTDEVLSVPHIAVTDSTHRTNLEAVGSLQWLSSGATTQPALAHWVVGSDHPIGQYLPPVEVVAASFSPVLSGAFPGEPIVWGLSGGERFPLVLAGEKEGRRYVTVSIDPSQSPSSIPLVVVFFNSLRWLMSESHMVRTGEPLSVGYIERGSVSINRPDGSLERRNHPGGVFNYESTAASGRYRIRSSGEDLQWAVNFLDPIESNIWRHVSTWQPLDPGAVDTTDERRSPHPLANIVIFLVLALLLFEWRHYCVRKQ